MEVGLELRQHQNSGTEKVKTQWFFSPGKVYFAQGGSQGNDSGYHSNPVNMPNGGGLDIDRFYGVSREHVSTFCKHPW